MFKPFKFVALSVLIFFQFVANNKVDLFAAQEVSAERIERPTFSSEYSNLMKKIMLTGIELERFSLNYRLECLKPSQFRLWRYFLAQEAGASGALAFEIVSTEQFNKGRKHPLQVSASALRGALATTMTTAIIAGSASGLELFTNFFLAYKRKKQGYDSYSARRYVLRKLNELDQLLFEREALLQANTKEIGYQRALVEGRILSDLRAAFIDEFSQFQADIKRYYAFTNTFYVFNIASNVVSATAAGTAYRATNNLKLNGPANILFIVAGGLFAVSPLLSTVISKIRYTESQEVLKKELHKNGSFDYAKLSQEQKEMQSLIPIGENTMMPSLSASKRLALYLQSEELFKEQLYSETIMMQKLGKVAVESSVLGPLIGGTLLSQGIVGTVGYYQYPLKLRAQFNHYYAGAIAGMSGAGTAVLGTAAFLLASVVYNHRLFKEKRLPSQLIRARLDHLDQIEETVNAI